MKRLWGVLAMVILATRLLAQSNAPVRLALVAETDEAAAASDVLTAQLSGNPKLQLLERNEIEKVYREQGLSAENKDYLKLGRVLGADGLLLFDVVRTPQTTNLTARLIAVKPGVVLTDGSFPWPLKDTTSWAESVATYLNAFLPKLALLPKDAIPISVVNLRSAIQSTEAQETERQLKLLTIQRLSQERQFFVLERQRMQLLNEEKELKADESAFWNGSYLLEGVLDQNGYSKETITLNARLTPPKGGAPLLIEVSGSRTNYSEVINRLAAKVTELLKVSSAIKEWNAADEAQQYFDEAKWALKWGVFSEAQAAAESAWALGKQDTECALVRVKSCLADAEPAELNELYEMFAYRDYDDIDSEFRKITRANPGNVLFSRTSTNSGQCVILKNHPDRFKFVRMVRALQLYETQLDSPLSSDPTIRKEWCELGTSLLETAGQWLRDYYFAKQARAEVETGLESARRSSRKIMSALAVMPETKGERFWDAVAGFGVFWCETPEEGVLLYKKLFGLRKFVSVRKRVTGDDPDDSFNKLLMPVLAAWREGDEDRIPRVWHDMVEEMCTSTNSDLRGNGYFIVCVEADDVQTFVKALRILRTYFFFGDDSSIIDESGKLWSEGIKKYPHEQWNLAWQTKLDPVIEQQTREAQSNATRHLTSSVPISSPRLRLTPGTNHHPLPTVRRAVDTPKESGTQPTNQLEVTRFWKAALPRPRQLEIFFPNQPTEPIPGTVLSFCCREGYLWAETRFQWYTVEPGRSRLVHQRVFFRVNLETFASETIPVDEDRYHLADSDVFCGSFRTFEVYSNHLYVSSTDGIKRYALANKTWEDLPVPVGGLARITALDGRIFLSSANAIVEMTPDGQTSKVLASTRRRPPLTMLDTMDDYQVKIMHNQSSCKFFAPVLPGPDGSVMILMNGQLFMLPRGASEWIPSTQIPEGREAERSFSAGGLLVLSALDYHMSPPPAPELYLIRAGSTNADCVIADKPVPGAQVFLNSINLHPKQTPSRWASPEGMRIADSPACLDGDTLWVLHGRPIDLNMTLLHFLPGQTNPASFRLHLKHPDAVGSHLEWNYPDKRLQIEATPQGIVFGGTRAGGFWFVPIAELQRNNQSELSK